MADYSEDIAMAQEMIQEAGQLCYWQKPPPTTGGSAAYPEVGEVPDPVECYIAFFSGRDLNRGTFEFLSMIPGTEVPDNAEIGLLAGGINFTPENTDMIHRGSPTADPISIEKIDRLAPDGTPILYYVQVAA